MGGGGAARLGHRPRPGRRPPAPRRPAGAPADRERDREGEERDHEREEDFGDSWRTYRERADHIRQTYSWTVPQPPPRAEHWLPLGRDNDQEDHEPHAWPRRRLDEERDSDRDER